jgi:PPM family protein phosphatase
METVTATWEGPRVRVRVCAASDLGRQRLGNEDRYATWVPTDPAELNRRGVLLVVADGMGGARGGEIASRMVVEGLLSAWRATPGAGLAEDLRAALASANRAVHGESVAHPELAGMGTTCTAAALHRDQIVLAHVGDSRAYLVRNGGIRQLTHDHSFVGQLVREGQLTPEQARSDPRRNVVTRSVGIGAEVEIDIERLEDRLTPGDTLLLCTDGLHGLLADEEIAALAAEPDLEHACAGLVERANARGGFDNITVMLARLDFGEAAPASGAAAAARTNAKPGGGGEPSRMRRGRVVLVLLALLALLAALAARLAARRVSAV